MKTIVSIAVAATMAIALAACANKSTVNILIANEHTSDTTHVVVHIAIDEIMQHVDAPSIDSLTLLNERNQPVAFTITSDGKNIEFAVPIVKARSQKNYSLNTSNPSLSDNLFSFRTTSINVKL